MRRLLVLAFIWGWSFLFIKVAVAGLSPPTVAFGRVMLGACVLFGALRLRGGSLPDDRASWRHFGVAALFGNVIPFTMLAWGEERITSALTAVLNASTPMFTAIAAAFYLNDRLSRSQTVGLLVGFGGVVVAAGFGGGDVARSSIYGALAAVGAGACYGTAFTYMRRHLVAVEPIIAATGQLLMASAMLAPLALVTSLSKGVDLTPRRVLALLALGVIGTGLAYILNYRVIAELGATKASLVTYVIPLVAVAVGVVVLGEPFESRLLLGGLLIAAGIVLVHDRRFRSVAAVAALLTVGITGCGSSGGSTTSTTATTSTSSASTTAPACMAEQHEPLDPNLTHVLPGAPEPKYISDPPTSGPHAPGEAPTGVVSEPLSRPRQVGALEAGAVLLQYRDLSSTEQQQLFALAGDKVIVAPNADLPDRVVATAWLFKRVCSAVDADALRAFATEHAGHGPGTDN